MKSATTKLILMFAGAILFNLVFWQEKLAINALLFDVFVWAAVFYLYPPTMQGSTMKGLMLAHAIALVTVIVHNTQLSKTAFSVSLLLMVIFTQYRHRSVWYAAGSAMGNYILLLFNFFDHAREVKGARIPYAGFRKVFRYMLIPVLIASLFIVMYSFSNAVFDVMFSDTLTAISHFFSTFFSWFSWERFGFLLIGLLITGGLLLKRTRNYFSDSDMKKQDSLLRKKSMYSYWNKTVLFDVFTVFMGRFANGMMALRNENRVGIISLVLLNILLLWINIIDIIYVWFGFSYTAHLNLTDYVHEGAGMLICSIVLAMMLLLFFFRGNLNFYQQNKWLRWGAYGWIVQNAVLVVSVLLRDGYYIQHMGLAYKRIGVLFFLAMVLMGLITVFIKIQSRKTGYYLWRVNGWFAMFLLVAASCIHWDETIAGYNLARSKTIPVDISFLLSLSDKTLPLIEKHIDLLTENQGASTNDALPLYQSRGTNLQIFEDRKQAFLEEQKGYSWLSWNMADAYVKKQLSLPVSLSTINQKR